MALTADEYTQPNGAPAGGFQEMKSPGYKIFNNSADPIGTQAGTPGDLYIRPNGVSTLIYQHKGAAANNTDWVIVGSGTDADAVHVNVNGEIAAVTNKAAPIGADKILIEDSEDLDSKKYINVSDMPTTFGGGNIELGAANILYFGDPLVDGTWRVKRDGANLVAEKRESGIYNIKLTIG